MDEWSEKIRGKSEWSRDPDEMQNWVKISLHSSESKHLERNTGQMFHFRHSCETELSSSLIFS